MHPGGSAGQPAPAATGTVTGHSYTAAYRYQLVIGKVGGWAIPYPLTIPQAVTGLSAVVFAMVTASWWYPITGVGGLLGVVALPIVGIRVISRIRPEGRSVSDWLYGWGVAQRHGLTGRGVRLHVGLTRVEDGRSAKPVLAAQAQTRSTISTGIPVGADSPGAIREPAVAETPDDVIPPSSLPRGSYTRLHQVAMASAAPHAASPKTGTASRFTGLLRTILHGRVNQADHRLVPQRAQSRTRTVHRVQRTPVAQRRRRAPQHPPAGQAPQRPPTTTHARWSALTRRFSKSSPPAEPPRVPVFDPWGVAHTQGGM